MEELALCIGRDAIDWNNVTDDTRACFFITESGRMRSHFNLPCYGRDEVPECIENPTFISIHIREIG